MNKNPYFFAMRGRRDSSPGAEGGAGAALWAGVKGRLPLCALICALILPLAALRNAGAASGTDRSSLAAALVGKKLALRPGPVAWLGPEGGPLSLRPALFAASREGELEDIYYAEVRSAAAGAVLDLWWLTDITRTSSASERFLTPIGPYLAYALQLGDTFDAVVVLDTRGEPSELTARWPASLKLRNAITNLQEYGRARGFGRKRYQFAEPVKELEMSRSGDALALIADGKRARIDLGSDRISGEEGLVQVQPMVKSQPGTITWLVDTVRNLSWVGPRPIEWLEHAVFRVTDRMDRVRYWIFGADTEAEVRRALNLSPQKPRGEKLPAPLTENVFDLGWPPPAMKPLLDDAAPGEGEWLPVVDPDFVSAYPNAPPAFHQTFIRVDPERQYTRVYVTLWDPRQVQLHIAMGTVEPESATGRTGSGMIPRDKTLLKRLVGAFNGGFQALHGEFGMMSDGQVYLPPKPWAATVAVFDDGRVGMGSWPGPGRREWDEEAANRQIPKNMVSMRQNLTSVVEDGQYNPWKRWWWGAAPEAAEEQTYIYRSGICLTEERFMAFFWGESMGPEELGRAMLAARCARGIHLDMNSAHTGFEFYKSYPPGSQPHPLDRELGDAEFEGEIDDIEGYRFRARKAVTTMKQLRFPRYIGRDPRDFFYLTLKPVLPGPDLSLPGGKKVRFSALGSPAAGGDWPPAFARAEIPLPGGAVVRLVRIDPNRVAPQAMADQGQVRALAYLTRLASPPPEGESRRQGPGASVAMAGGGSEELGGEGALFALARRLGWRFSVGKAPRGARVLVEGPLLSRAPRAEAAIGVDEEGFVLYAELAPPGGVDGLLWSRLRDAGVREAIALPSGSRLAFAIEGKYLGVDGQPGIAVDPRADLAFLAEERPAADIMFPETKPRPYRNWGWLQGRRVRYFPEGPPRFPIPDHLK